PRHHPQEDHEVKEEGMTTENPEVPADETGGIKKKSKVGLVLLALPLPIKLILLVATPIAVLLGGFFAVIAVAAFPVTWPLVLVLGVHLAWAITAAIKKKGRHSLGATFARL